MITTMKTNFCATVPQVFCTLLACGALTGLLAAATPDDKSPDKRSANKNVAMVSAERVALAAVQAHLTTKPLRRMSDWADDPNEADQLLSIFDNAQKAYASVAPGPNEGVQRKAISLELTRELESFLQQHPSSGWAPDVHLQLALACQLRSSYSKAIQYYASAWATTKDSDQDPARLIAFDAAGPLAKLLALTGRLDELDALQAEARAAGKEPPSSDWAWAFDLARLSRKHPTEAYKCGLYCLDQLGRLTQAGSYYPKDVTETESSLNGFTAAELVAIGQKAGLKVHAVFLQDLSEFPVPCAVHLKVQHFVVVRERRGGFYQVMDPVAYGRRWLTAAELAEDASGCLLVSTASTGSSTMMQQLQLLNDAAAAGYRGRCHGSLLQRHADPGLCPPPGSEICKCPPGGGGGGGGKERNSIWGDDHSACCSSCGGIPIWHLSEGYDDIWIYDSPLQYQAAYGPSISFTLAFDGGRDARGISGLLNQGALAGRYWSCTWLSYAEVDSSGYSAEVSLPGSGWATFDFPSGGNNSDVHYKRNTWLEKVFQGGSLVGLRLHEERPLAL